MNSGSKNPRKIPGVVAYVRNSSDGKIGGGDRWIPTALWPGGLAYLVKIQANERSCLKQKVPKE